MKQLPQAAKRRNHFLTFWLLVFFIAQSIFLIQQLKSANMDTLPTIAKSLITLSDSTVTSDGSNVTEQRIYLTFDDGPSANTPAILDVLDRYQIKATFFITGMFPQYAPYLKLIDEKGHTLGLHSMSHKYDQIYASEDAFYQDLSEIGAFVNEQVGYTPHYIRFPGGSSNGISKQYCPGIMTKLTQSVLEKGYQYYDWNADTQDALSHLTAYQIFQNAKKCNQTTIILLCHDASNRPSTVEALPLIIEYYQEKGYTFLPISEESVAVHHRVHN